MDGMEVRQAKKTKAWCVRDTDGLRYKAIGNSKAVIVRTRATDAYPRQRLR
jgi:DNA (cytosine-5)-methyltransferase 1